jgi:hypothetical protein
MEQRRLASEPALSRVQHSGECRLDQARHGSLRRLAISFSQGAEWKALISKYIGTIPLSADPCPAEQSAAIGPSLSTPVSSAMIAKVGDAAKYSQSTMTRPAAALWSLQLPRPVELVA